jgi:hypothetical protein
MGRNRPRKPIPGQPLTRPKQPKQPKAQSRGEGDGPRPPPRSFLSFLAAAAAFAGAVAWLGVLRPQRKRVSDREVLARLAAKPLVYTSHGACRMECRFVGRGEVEEALVRGSINDRCAGGRDRDRGINLSQTLRRDLCCTPLLNLTQPAAVACSHHV